MEPLYGPGNGPIEISATTGSRTPQRLPINPKSNRQCILGELVFGRDHKIVQAVEKQSATDLAVRPVGLVVKVEIKELTIRAIARRFGEGFTSAIVKHIPVWRGLPA